MLTLTLNRKKLVALRACSSGIALFDLIKSGQDDIRRAAGKSPRRDLRVRWGFMEQIWLATAWPNYFRWMIERGLIGPVHGRPGADLRGARLDVAELAGANLEGAHLECAKMRSAHLKGANLSGAHLDGADLSNSLLAGADLNRAVVLDTDFSGADLSGADLRYVAHVPSAHFEHARLTGARWDEGVPPPKGWQMDQTGLALERANGVTT